MHRSGFGGHSPFGPRLPMSPVYADLQRAIAEILASWSERVQGHRPLSVLDTKLVGCATSRPPSTSTPRCSALT